MNWMEEQEKEANTFAFAFLMPEKEVRKIFEEKNGNLESIAEYFNVSLATANQRLINLGLKKMTSDIVVMPIERIKKKCLCCGNEMELFVYEDRDFCDRCFYIVCREVFNKANNRMTVKEVKERIRRNIEE